MKLAWSHLARQELTDLRQYSIANWGPVVARRYLEDIRDAAKAAAARPDRTRALRGAFRIQRVGSHYLIIHVDHDVQVITIARVLHAAMDIERHLPDAYTPAPAMGSD